MYQVHNIEYYKIYDAKNDDFIFYAYSKDELIDFIAHCYDGWDSYRDCFFSEDYPIKLLPNNFINRCTTNIKELGDTKRYIIKRYIIYDNFDRIINVFDFEEEAYKLFKIYKKQGKVSYWGLGWGWRFLDNIKLKKKKRRNYFDNKYSYRKDPVPYTHKWHGGPSQRAPRTAKIIRIHKNPEYKEFNRGSISMIPRWWDDKYRTVQRSWKSQSKFRHQWEKNSLKNLI